MTAQRREEKGDESFLLRQGCSPDMVRLLKGFKEVCDEVLPQPLRVWGLMIAKQKEPADELLIWVRVVRSYSNFKDEFPKATFKQKHAAFALLVDSSASESEDFVAGDDEYLESPLSDDQVVSLAKNFQKELVLQ
jgi:hypothetical protein